MTRLGKWLDSRPGRSLSVETAPGTHRTERWVGPKASVDALKPLSGIETQFLDWPVPSLIFHPRYELQLNSRHKN